jgi:spermidine synthase
MESNKKFLLLSAITGFSVMVIELTATRILAPILGNSIYTWTSIIGIVLLGSSMGNHIGGKIADKNQKINNLSISFLLSSVCVLLIIPISKSTSSLLINLPALWLSNILASLLFFFIPAFILGGVYPMIAKLYMKNIDSVGRNAGTLSAFWSAGSIIGTFLTGFIFIGYFGSRNTLLIISSILFCCSLFLVKKNKNKLYSLLAYALMLAFFFKITNISTAKSPIVFEKESDYYGIQVIDKDLPQLGKTRILFLDAGSHSLKSLDNKNFDSYVNIYPAFSVFNDDIKEVAVIGGGSLELSDNFKKQYSKANVTTIEIDPEVTNAAKEYFKPSKYVLENTVSEDGRVFLAQSTKKYDVIFSDAYNSFISVPWHLATKEFFQLSRERLSDNGVFAINFLASQTKDDTQFYQSMVATFSSVFKNYYVFTYGDNSSVAENIILIGTNSNASKPYKILQLQLANNPDTKLLANHLTNPSDNKKNSKPIIFTDNFAPTDRQMITSINKYFKPYMQFMHLGI